MNVSRKSKHMTYNHNYEASFYFWLKQCQQSNTFAVVTKINCKVPCEEFFVLHTTFTYIPDMQLDVACP